ncbi:MAG: hypothetical protein ABII26_07615 [Pseudomonadota bacterium]
MPQTSSDPSSAVALLRRVEAILKPQTADQDLVAAEGLHWVLVTADVDEKVR